jgi:hypothetical protein
MHFLQQDPITDDTYPRVATGIKQAKALYAYTLKHGYGRDLTKQYMANLKTLRATYNSRPHHKVDLE